GGTVRTPVAPEAFQLEDLPRITMPDPLDAAAAPYQAAGDEATELAVDWKSSSNPLGATKSDTFTSVRISLAGQVYGRIRIGYSEGTVTGAGAGGIYVSCGGLATSLRKLVPARWEMIETTPKGSLSYRVVNAWFDPQTCKASIVARASVAAPRLVGGMLYAFRQVPASGASDEALVLIGPRFAHLATGAIGGDSIVAGGAFTRVTFPVRRGGGASLVGRIAATTAREWAQTLGVAPV